MRRHATGDVWTDAKLLQAEELMADARVWAARRALLRGPRAPRGGVRGWLGGVLLATGHRLLGSRARPDRDASDAPGRADACPVCRSPWLETSHRLRPGG